MKVVWFSTASGQPSDPGSKGSSAHAFLAALKGGRVNGECLIPVGSNQRILSKSNLDDAIDWFGEMVAGYLQRQSIAPPLFLVPIPNSEITLESSRPPWTSLLAMAIASKLESDVAVLDLLRWRKRLPEPAPQTPPRDVGKLYANLAVTRKIERPGSAVLVDYLAHSVSSIQVCAAALKANGLSVVLATFAGRIAELPPKDPFAVMRTEVPDFTPTGLNI
jgi:hypothetical protein